MKLVCYDRTKAFAQMSEIVLLSIQGAVGQAYEALIPLLTKCNWFLTSNKQNNTCLAFVISTLYSRGRWIIKK